MQKSAAILLTILATTALAFQGRPVSDLRFEGREAVFDYRVASDGTDYLLLSRRYEWGENSTFIEKVVDGRTAGSQRYLGPGAPVGLAWTGTQYLAALGDHIDGLRIAALSRDGSLISMSETAVMQGESFAMAANDTGALVFGLTENKITVQPLDLTGRPGGMARTYDVPAYRPAMRAAPIVGGFGVVFSGFNTTSLMLFRADGTTMTPNPVTIEGPYGGSISEYHSIGAAMATDGIDIMVVFGTRIHQGPAELKTAVVGSNGTVKSVRVIHTLPPSVPDGPSIIPFGLVWTGTQYIATVSVDKDPTYADEDLDPALVPITSYGDPAGELTFVIEAEGRQAVSALGWNGTELLVPMYEPWPVDTSFCVMVDPSTMQQSPLARFGRTLTTQWGLALQAGHGGSLAAWVEQSEGELTLRASRIDTAGNYLDGEGVILEAIPSEGTPTWELNGRTIVIDGHGPQWFVAWSDGETIRGRALSPQGVAGAATIQIGSGADVAVRWDGAQYVVLRSDLSLYSNTVSLNGVVGETKIVAASENLGSNNRIEYDEPQLTRLGSRMLAVYVKVHTTCYLGTPGGCDSDSAAIGRLLDEEDSSPFVIAANVDDLSLSASPTEAMVLWLNHEGLSGAFLPAGAPQQVGAAFRIDSRATFGSAGFDGHDFVAAWWLHPYQSPRTLVTARITARGSVDDRRELSFLPRPFWAEHPALAAAANFPAMVGFVSQIPTYDSVPRVGVLFMDEIGDDRAAPPAPRITCASQLDDRIRVSWERIANVLGVAIEIQLSDGTFRTIGVASSDATTATVPLAGLDGSAVRIRAWNGFGISQASAIAPNLPAPVIAQQSRMVLVSRNQPATLSVVTAAHGTRFAWYEGVRGDTAHPVGSNDATFTTPPATRTMHYWVRLTTTCGTIDSETMTVSVDTRRRAARK